MSQKNTTRRKFIRNSSLAAAGFLIVPRHVLGKGFIAPSDTLHIAGIGVGGKGESDLTAFFNTGNVRIVALCDVDDNMAAASRKRFDKAAYYKDFREMLDKQKNSIDAVSVSTPDHSHANATLAAMQLGKHVYTQKPLTHNISEARILTEAAKRYRVVTQMGNQGASGEGVRRTKELIDAGLLGEVLTVHAWTNRPVWPQGVPTPTGKYPVPATLDWDLWLGPARAVDYHPSYHPFNWRGWWSFGTGALGDMACHVLDPVFRILPIDYPSSVECSVANTWKDMWVENEYPDSCPSSSMIHLHYPRTDGKGSIQLSWYDGGLLPPRPEELLPEEAFGSWDGGLLFIGTKGKLLTDCYGDNARLLPTSRMKEALPPIRLPRVPEGHYAQWVNACIAGYGNAITSSPFSYAGPFTESVLIGNLAIRSWMYKKPNYTGWGDKYPGRKTLLWDAKNMRVTNFEEANGFVYPKRRAGWELQ